MKLLKKDGFTLIELMIVVVIIGILAAVAIPQFLKYQLKSKTTEATRNLGAIKTNEEAFAAKWNSFAVAKAIPTAVPGATKATWPNPVPEAGKGLDLLGFAPSGQVYYQYGVMQMPGTLTMTGTTCEGSGIADPGASSEIGVTAGLPTVTPQVSRVNASNAILMWAKGNLDGAAGTSCFGITDFTGEIIPVPGSSGDAVF